VAWQPTSPTRFFQRLVVEHPEFGPARGRKRKRHVNEQCGDDLVDVNSEVTSETGGANDGWRPLTDGKWLSKRVGKQVVRKPVERLDARMRRDPSTGSVSSLGDSVASSKDGTPDGNRELKVILCSIPKPATHSTETALHPADRSI
jgi:hypothetical protein